MNNKLFKTNALIVALLLILQGNVYAQEVDQKTTPQEEVELSSEIQKQLPNDPRVNPKISFKSKYRSKGPIPIFFSYQTEKKERYNAKLNQLTTVTKSQLAGANAQAVISMVANGIAGGRVQGGANQYGFQTRDTIVGFRIPNVVDRSKLENPALNDIPKLLDQKIIEYIEQNIELKKRQYYQKLVIRPWQWSLVFNESENNPNSLDYVLKFKATLSKIIEGDKTSLFHLAKEKVSVCTFESDAKSLEEWKVNDYVAITELRPKIIDRCITNFTDSIPDLLQEDEHLKEIPIKKKIRSATILCKEVYRQCVQIVKNEDDEAQDSGIFQCKTDYKQCRTDSIQPLIASTPKGQCRIPLDACKVSVKEKAGTVEKDVLRQELKVCVADYESCIERFEDKEDSSGKSDPDND